MLVAAIAGSSALSWLALWRWGSSPDSGFTHAHVHFAARSDAGLFVAFLAGWTLMLVGMMLPTSIPLVALFSKLTRERRDHWTLVSLVVAGYLAVWVLFGAAVYLALSSLLGLFPLAHWLHLHARWLAAGTLVIAGVYQFTPLKYRCLEKCRSPFSFISEHWSGQDERKEALWLGAHHGIFCVGCCWSLMLLMFTLGAGSIGWMLLLGTLMAVEKNSRWGKPFARALGFSLLVAGITFGLWPAT